MSHIFDGTWSHFKIGVLGVPPSPPTKGDDFVLAIDALGVVDPLQSTVDGIAVLSGRADTKTIDLVTVAGRRYFGRHLKTNIVDSKPVIVIAGRFGPAASPPNAKGKGKNAAANGQNEGDWVITKP